MALTKTVCFVVFFAVLAARAGDAVPTAAEPLTNEVLRRLESRLANIKTVSTQFVQEKELAILKHKAVLKGRITLQNPNRLAWQVDEPVRYALVITDNTIRQWDEETGQVVQMAISANPVLQVVAEQLRRWFSGQYAALGEMYAVAVLQETPCRLEFTPRPTAVTRKAIKRVTVGFRADEQYVNEIVIEDQSGDRSTLWFTNTVLNAPLAADVWEVKPRGR